MADLGKHAKGVVVPDLSFEVAVSFLFLLIGLTTAVSHLNHLNFLAHGSQIGFIELAQGIKNLQGIFTPGDKGSVLEFR